MKNLVYTLFLFFSFLRSFSQDTIYLKNENDTFPSFRAEAKYFKVINSSISPIEVSLYYTNGVIISKSHLSSLSPIMNEGAFESYFYNGRVKVKGIFKNDKMEGSWIAYNKDKNFIEEKIDYKNNLREGKGYIFYETGKLKRIDVYVRDTSILSTCYDSLGNTMNCDSMEWIGVLPQAEVPPSFPGGFQALMQYLMNTVRYPKEAREDGLQGKVIVKFYIDTDGSVRDPIVLKDGVGGGCAEEAIRVCKLMPQWIPGSQKGKPVKVYFTMPIAFRIQ